MLRLVGSAPASRALDARVDRVDLVDLSAEARLRAPSPEAQAQTGGLLAGRVPGGVAFVGHPTSVAAHAMAAPGVAARSDALPFYRHPADLNAAATSINAGRILDVNA
jgi:hypothetical protein